MFGKHFTRQLINQSAVNEHDRRHFLKAAGLTSLGAIGAGVAATTLGGEAADAMSAVSDATVLNFALNLEYLEAEFYYTAVNGTHLPETHTSGTGGVAGPTTGGRRVDDFTTSNKSAAQQYVEEITNDEVAHVKFLRSALGSSRVGKPAIDIGTAFTTAARAAGVVPADGTFDPYADSTSFLLAAYIFEDVGVTAYKGAAALISNKTYLTAAAGILAAEAYHAATVRTFLFAADFNDEDHTIASQVQKISNLRDSLDAPTDTDQGIRNTVDGEITANLTPLDRNGIAYSRNPRNVLNIVYGTPNEASKGLFFPSGMRGDVRTSFQH